MTTKTCGSCSKLFKVKRKWHRLLRDHWLAIVYIAGGLVLLSAVSLQCQAEDGPILDDSPGIAVLREQWKSPEFREGRARAFDAMARARGVFKPFRSQDQIIRDAPTTCYHSLDFRLDFVEGDFEPAIVPKDVTDELLAETLRYLPELEEVRLPYTAVTDSGLSHLSWLPGLRKLELIYGPSGQFPCHITDSGMLALSNAHSLEHLALACVPLSNKGAAHLASLDNLETLSIWSTSEEMSSNVFCHLTRMKRLSELSLCFFDHDIALVDGHLSTVILPLDSGVPPCMAILNGKLQKLFLGGSVHPQVLRAIGQIDSLTSLNLANTNATSAELDAIVREIDRPLDSLNVPRASVSGSSAAALELKWPRSMKVDGEPVTWREFRSLADDAAPQNSGSE